MMSCPIHPTPPRGAFDPGLVRPVRFVAPPAEMPAAERARLESEKVCLERELATTQRGLKSINDKLAA